MACFWGMPLASAVFLTLAGLVLATGAPFIDDTDEVLHLVQRSASSRRSRGPAAEGPFRAALVVSIDPESYKATEGELRDQGVLAEMVRGFDGKSAEELEGALQLLTDYGNTQHLHPTVSNWLLCMHTSPGKPPNITAASAELWHNLMRQAPRNVTELLARDQHGCVPKVIAIAAAHLRLWQGLANGSLPARTDLGELTGEDPWYLVMEDDVALCPAWRERMMQELPQAPIDADVIKLYFFGHWRKEDAVTGLNNSATPFLEARDPLRSFDLFKAASYELLHGRGWSSVPIAGFYAGTQAYLIRPSGARKLLKKIRGQPFQEQGRYWWLLASLLGAGTLLWHRH
ncbi:unnamed protein product [Durusdinium trenchii]|uniref:Uncharacterized protein n=1 Tax=Durusdinium trenchii TaxID=1381693 RepID=A0ABP0HKZ3_9DINO